MPEHLIGIDLHRLNARVPSRSCNVWNPSPSDAEMHGWFAERLQAIAPQRDDISTFFDLLDLDDHASFGGRG